MDKTDKGIGWSPRSNFIRRNQCFVHKPGVIPPKNVGLKKTMKNLSNIDSTDRSKLYPGEDLATSHSGEMADGKAGPRTLSIFQRWLSSLKPEIVFAKKFDLIEDQYFKGANSTSPKLDL